VQSSLFTPAGGRRSPVTLPGYRAGMPAPNKGMKLPAEPLSRRDVEKLMAACSSRGAAGHRDRAMIALLYRTGLRIGEALALLPKDVDLEHGLVIVLHGKGNRRRTVGIDPATCAILERWMTRRRALGVGPRAPIFCVVSHPNRGKPQHASVFREKLKALAWKAGVDRRVHPHGLRHTLAFELATEGTPVNVIRRQLGHTNLGTTQRYIDHLAPGDVIAAMRSRDWEPH
jgi:site-specific recombinase XerD